MMTLIRRFDTIGQRMSSVHVWNFVSRLEFPMGYLGPAGIPVPCPLIPVLRKPEQWCERSRACSTVSGTDF